MSTSKDPPKTVRLGLPELEGWRSSIAAAVGCDVADIKTVKELRGVEVAEEDLALLRDTSLNEHTTDSGHCLGCRVEDLREEARARVLVVVRRVLLDQSASLEERRLAAEALELAYPEAGFA